MLKLMSRFALTSEQAIRWFDCSRRAKGTTTMVTDRQVLENPYRMSEVDLGTRTDSPISVGIIDRGLLPDSTIDSKHPVPAPSSVGSPNDARRLRAAIVTVLREASINGDSLLSTSETLQRAANLDLAHPCEIRSDWPSTNPSALDGVVEHVDISSGDTENQSMSALQLTEVKECESWLRKVLSGRANKPIATVNSPWKHLIERAITMAGDKYDASNEQHALAILEQAKALDRITSRRLSVLVGRAGTGKTAVMGALTLSEPLMQDGVLLLAPTGKARVQLSNATKTEAMTVAQFLYRLRRYDGMRQRPLLKGNEIYRKEKTVVVDESSMLTMDDMVAILKALDLAHVQRVIFVGDPNQLPPIGIGRPFADLVSYLETTSDKAQDGTPVGNALARLKVEVRKGSKAGDPSDALRLASWFTREPQPVDADRVLSDLELGEKFNDLDIEFWKTPDELSASITKVFQRHLQLANPNDIDGFNISLGIENGWIPFDQPSGSENWQILSPVRMHPHGVHHLNRWVQLKFRSAETGHAAHSWGISLGDEKIVKNDKVIQTYNELRDAYDGRTSEEYYLANGEVGLVSRGNNGWLNVLFAGRPNLRFGYRNSHFRGGSGPLELAYALTIHKSQGSQFRKVFVVLPKESRILTRELIYTALTRSRDQLVLLIEGENATTLFDLSQPERSETARRNTNLFQSVVRASEDKIPYADHLIHTTEKGHLVRSKSELVISNMLFREGIDYQYERVYEGTAKPGRMRPDFSFVKLDGDLIIWEHLGMLDREDYKKGWEWKRDWYLANGFTENETLFTSTESAEHGLDSTKLKNIANTIKEQIE